MRDGTQVCDESLLKMKINTEEEEQTNNKQRKTSLRRPENDYFDDAFISFQLQFRRNRGNEFTQIRKMR